MAKCKECLHYEACVAFSKIINAAVDVEKGCRHFKDCAGFVEVVRCKDCCYRGNPDACPMCYEEQIEWDDDGYTEVDWILHDRTQDEGFCEGGERKDNG